MSLLEGKEWLITSGFVALCAYLGNISEKRGIFPIDKKDGRIILLPSSLSLK
jgi:hypothetical protein